MSFWSKLTKPVDWVLGSAGDIVQSVTGIDLGLDTIIDSGTIASRAAAKAKNKTVSAVVIGGTKPAANTTDVTNSVYSSTNDESALVTLAKALGLNINLGADGKVTGSLSAGTAANPAANAIDSITTALAKYWWILLIVGGAVLIFRRRGRR